MRRLELPEPPPGPWRGVTVESCELAGIAMTVVTVRPRAGQPLERTWYADGAVAFAFALSQADNRRLPLFDLRESGAD